jgi:hypothetical protein
MRFAGIWKWAESVYLKAKRARFRRSGPRDVFIDAERLAHKILALNWLAALDLYTKSPRSP